MLSPDYILINRASRIIPEYSQKTNQRNRPPVFADLALIVPIILVAVAYLLDTVAPVKPAELSAVNLGVFTIAVALSRLFGRAGAWIGAAAALLVIGWITPPSARGLLLFNTVMIMAVAMIAAPRAPIRWPPLRRWAKKAAQPPGEDLERPQRRLAVDNHTPHY